LYFSTDGCINKSLTHSLTRVLQIMNSISAQQHLCKARYMLSPVRPSVCLSVCHMGGSVKNGRS